MRKKILMFALMGWLGAAAQEERPAVVVWQGETEMMSIYVEDEPTVRIEEGCAIVSAAGTFEDWFSEYEFVERSFYFSFPISDDYRLTLEKRGYNGFPKEGETGIQAVTADKGKACFEVRGGRLAVWGLKAGAEVSLFDTDGRKIAGARAEGDRAEVDLPKKAGVVVVKAGDVSFKIFAR